MIPLLLLPLLFAPLGPDKLALGRQWSTSPSPELRMQAVRVLHGYPGQDSRAALLQMLSDDHPAVRAAVRDALVDRKEPLAAEIAQLKSARARLEGVRVLAEQKDRDGCALLATDRDASVRARALASGHVRPAEASPSLKHADPKVRAFALECVADPALARRRLRSSAVEERIAAARVVDDTASFGQLLKDRSWRVRLAAVMACERWARPALVPALIGVLKGPPGRVRARAAETLEKLTQAPFGEHAERWETWWKKRGTEYRFPPRREIKQRKEHSSARVVFRRIPVVSRRVCFVLDASRSMDKPAPGARGKSRWQLVVRDLVEVVRRLPGGARFNIVLFRTGVEAWRKRLVPVGPGTRRACSEWIEAAKPAGWTNLFDAIELALSDDEVDAVYVLTDGVPSRGAETKRQAILDEIAFMNHYRLVQINCVQAGGEQGLNPRWRGFLEELAKQHDGVAVREG